VNFYKRFIGDITAKTGGLSLARMGAYDRLLDHFYSTELPIPPEEVYSICRAMTRADRTDVDAVLRRFWDLTPDGYVQAKAEEVIAKARPLIEAARENGRKGGRPRKTKNPDETQRVPPENPEGTQPEPSSKASQSQSQTHSPSLRSGEVGAESLGVPAQMLADWLVVRKAKKVGALTVTAAAQLQREAEKAGITAAQAIEACCLYGWGGFNAKWYAERQGQIRAGGAETVYQQSQRERVAEFAPGVAKRPSAIDVESANVIAIAGR
jgi:uncharacterized protein YdaU (DUF1376 family)